MSDKQAALVDLDRAIALDPNAPSAWLARGQIKAEMGDGEGAREDLKHCLELAPEGPAASEAHEALTGQEGR